MSPNNYKYSPLARFDGVAGSTLPPKIQGLIITISFYLHELEVLSDRLDADIPPAFTEVSYKPYFILLTDVHFYVISWANLQKSLHRLYQVTNDSQIESIRLKRKKWFETMRRARNNIEHIDERAITTPEIRHTPKIISVRGKNTAYIYGEKIDNRPLA
jgi:hypothetical protein